MQQTITVEELGHGEPLFQINERDVVMHELNTNHKFYACRNSTDKKLELFIKIGEYKKRLNPRKLSCAGYQVRIVKDNKHNEDFLHIANISNRDNKGVALGSLVAYIVKELCMDYRSKETIEEVVELLEYYRKANAVKASEGMSPNDQVGLYGELYIIKNVLWPAIRNWKTILEIWKGYDKASQDFISHKWILEVRWTPMFGQYGLRIS